jgi:hypothetical protein
MKLSVVEVLHRAQLPVGLDKTGITPRQEDIPLTIDAQYVVGFDWTRRRRPTRVARS